MLSSGVTSCSNLDLDECRLSPLLDLATLPLTAVSALEGGREYWAGSRRTVEARERGVRLVEATEGGMGYSAGSRRDVEARERAGRLFEADEAGGG